MYILIFKKVKCASYIYLLYSICCFSFHVEKKNFTADITETERRTGTPGPTGHTEKAWGGGQWKCPGARACGAGQWLQPAC